MSDTPLTDESICRRTEYSGYGVDRIAVDVSYVEVNDCRNIERELRDEINEQARIIGMGGERELRLMAERDAAGRRPETCYEMSVIDNAMAKERDN